MRLTRCHVDQLLAPGDEARLPESVSARLRRVMRLEPGDGFVLFNGDGCDYAATLVGGSREAVTARVDARLPVQRESPLRLVLAQAIARGEKMDLILQKATELGVSAVIPIVSQRTEVRLDARRMAKRLERWRSILIAACEQCGRARVPTLGRVRSLPEWLQAAPEPGVDGIDSQTRLPLHHLQPDAQAGLNDLVLSGGGLCVVIGPEGGLDASETALLRQAGSRGIRLGPRILRTETAGLAFLAATQALHGDLRGTGSGVVGCAPE